MSPYIEFALALVDRIVQAETRAYAAYHDTQAQQIRELGENLQYVEEGYESERTLHQAAVRQIEQLQRDAHEQQSEYEELLREKSVEARERRETQKEIDFAVTRLWALLGKPMPAAPPPGTLADLLNQAEEVFKRESLINGKFARIRVVLRNRLELEPQESDRYTLEELLERALSTGAKKGC